MIVCVCHRVSDRDIARAVQRGCASFDELQWDLSVATCCGKCHDCARQTFDHQMAQAATGVIGACGKHPGGHARVIAISGQPHMGREAASTSATV